MDLTIHSQVRTYLSSRLSLHGDISMLGDDDLLFSSARLDSLDAVELVIFLEENFGIDFSKVDFDLTLLDSLKSICHLIANKDPIA